MKIVISWGLNFSTRSNSYLLSVVVIMEVNLPVGKTSHKAELPNCVINLEYVKPKKLFTVFRLLKQTSLRNFHL